MDDLLNNNYTLAYNRGVYVYVCVYVYMQVYINLYNNVFS